MKNKKENGQQHIHNDRSTYSGSRCLSNSQNFKLINNKDGIANGAQSNVVYKFKCHRFNWFHVHRCNHQAFANKNAWKPVPSEIGLHYHIAKLEKISIVLKTDHKLIRKLPCLPFSSWRWESWQQHTSISTEALQLWLFVLIAD